MNMTYLTTEELAVRIKYDPKTIRQQLKDSVLIYGKHYIKPFGRRKILYLWEVIEEEMLSGSEKKEVISIPMANGETCNG